MVKEEEIKKAINTILEMIYWSYQKDLKNGNLKDGICSENKQTVGKSAQKAKAFQQTAIMFDK